jgi:hypothetical protein
MMFVVTRSGDTAPAVQVDFATQDGTAHAGIDYTATSGTLNFGPGETMKTVAVPILSNTMLLSCRRGRPHQLTQNRLLRRPAQPGRV